jgi:hypothetical protein
MATREEILLDLDEENKNKAKRKSSAPKMDLPAPVRKFASEGAKYLTGNPIFAPTNAALQAAEASGFNFRDAAAGISKLFTDSAKETAGQVGERITPVIDTIGGAASQRTTEEEVARKADLNKTPTERFMDDTIDRVVRQDALAPVGNAPTINAPKVNTPATNASTTNAPARPSVRRSGPDIVVVDESGAYDLGRNRIAGSDEFLARRKTRPEGGLARDFEGSTRSFDITQEGGVQVIRGKSDQFVQPGQQRGGQSPTSLRDQLAVLNYQRNLANDQFNRNRVGFEQAQDTREEMRGLVEAFEGDPRRVSTTNEELDEEIGNFAVTVAQRSGQPVNPTDINNLFAKAVIEEANAIREKQGWLPQLGSNPLKNGEAINRVYLKVVPQLVEAKIMDEKNAEEFLKSKGLSQ